MEISYFINKASSNIVAERVESNTNERVVVDFLVRVLFSNKELPSQLTFEVHIIPYPDARVILAAGDYEWSLETNVKGSDRAPMESIE